MIKVTTYKVRSANAIPIMPQGGGSSSDGVIVFTFGSETQETISCGSDRDVIRSSDMCLLGGEYFSANYSALPGKINGDLVFQSNLAKVPVLSKNYVTGCLEGDI